MDALEAFRRALADLRSIGTPLILLRERGLDPEAAAEPGDYDLLLPDGDRAFERALEAWMASLAASGVSTRLHNSKPEKRRAVIFDSEGPGRIEADLWREHKVAVPRGGRSRARRAPRLLYSGLLPYSRLESDVLRMAPWLELAVYLCHLHEKRKDLSSAGVRERLGRHAAIDWDRAGAPASARQALEAMPGGLLEGTLDATEAAGEAARALGALGLPRPPAGRWESSRWWWSRKWRSVSRRLARDSVVAVVGPDGAGKTTIIGSALRTPLQGGRPIEAVVFKRLYRRSIFRFLYKTVRKLRRLRRRDEEKEVVEVALAPFLFAGALLNFGFARVFRRRGRLLLFDRYFTDLLVTNRKERTSQLELTWSYPFLARIVPRPDAIVLLSARPEVLLTRKAEMTPENASRYTRLMVSHYTRFPARDLLLLATDVPLERSIQVLTELLEEVASR